MYNLNVLDSKIRLQKKARVDADLPTSFMLLCAEKRKADAVDYQERIRLKRRLSKLKLKERRAADKSTHQKCQSPLAKKSKLEAVDDQPAPILNSEGKIVYSKFDLATTKQEEKEQGKGKQLQGKDYKKLLNVVVKRNEKLADLKGKSPETAAKFESKLHWQAALQRAGGRKVKVSPCFR